MQQFNKNKKERKDESITLFTKFDINFIDNYRKFRDCSDKASYKKEDSKGY